jgi:hypothetical protein
VCIGSDGNVWANAGGTIGRFTMSEVETDFNLPGGGLPSVTPYAILTGPDGNIWASGGPGAVVFDTSGTVLHSFTFPTIPFLLIQQFTMVASTNYVWMTYNQSSGSNLGKLLRSDMSFTTTLFDDSSGAYPVPPGGSGSTQINYVTIVGSNGAEVWLFAEGYSAHGPSTSPENFTALYKVTEAGVFTCVTVWWSGSSPPSIAVPALWDGTKFWFSGNSSSPAFYTMDTGGSYTSHSPTGVGETVSAAPYLDGSKVWFAGQDIAGTVVEAYRIDDSTPGILDEAIDNTLMPLDYQYCVVMGPDNWLWMGATNGMYHQKRCPPNSPIVMMP